MQPTSGDSGINPDLLRGAELFSALLEEDLDYFASRTSFLELKKGGRLFSAGDPASHFYIVREGSIRVFRPREGGGSDEMAIFAPGDALGDFDFARRAKFDACAEAASDSVLLAFPGEGLVLDDISRERPAASARLLLRSLAMIASRLRSTQVLISENSPWVRELRRRSMEDPGTGLWNRVYLDEEVTRLGKEPFALILLKPDRFKELVDSRGHGAGDEAMVRIAGVLKSTMRNFGRGFAARLKSNEVAVLLPQGTAAEAETVAQELAAGILSLTPVPGSAELPAFAFSATVVYAVRPSSGPAWERFFEEAYAGLLVAWKHRVRRIVMIPISAEMIQSEKQP
jgi:diguanylate cyclase (GGDEF)-like protein